MKIKFLSRCELVNARRKPQNSFRRVLASLQRFIRKIPSVSRGLGGRVERVCELVNERAAPKKNSEFVRKFANSRREKRNGRAGARLLKFLFRLVVSFLNVGGFARSFRLLSDSFRYFRRLVLVAFVFSFLDAFAAGQPTAPEIELKLDRIENNISNLTSAVEMLQQQVGALNVSVGGSLSNNVNDFSSAFNDFVDTWKKVVGATPTANHTLTWSMENMRLNLQQLLNSVRNSIVPSLNSISNVLSQVDFEGLTQSAYNIESYCTIIYDELLELKYILYSIWELQENWSSVHTNQLTEILEKIEDIKAAVSNVWGGGSGDALAVRVEGSVDVGTVSLDSSGLWDMDWSFSGSYLKYLDRVAGKDKWHPDYIQTESATIYGSGNDYRHGVIHGFQNLMDIHAEQLESSQRILLCLQPTNDLSEIKKDFEDKSNEGKQETDRVSDEIEASVDEFSSFTWHSRIEDGIETAFSPFLEFIPPQNLGEGVRFIVPGGKCMGFQWETYTVDCTSILNFEVADFIRTWILFFFYGGMIFLVLRVFPWGVARFATVVYYLSNINKNLGG